LEGGKFIGAGSGCDGGVSRLLARRRIAEDRAELRKCRRRRKQCGERKQHDWADATRHQDQFTASAGVN